MEMIYILGLVLGLAVLILMGFKGWGMVPTSIVASLVVIITNRMDLWEAISQHYGTFMKNYAGSYFLMLFWAPCSALSWAVAVWPKPSPVRLWTCWAPSGPFWWSSSFRPSCPTAA